MKTLKTHVQNPGDLKQGKRKKEMHLAINQNKYICHLTHLQPQQYSNLIQGSHDHTHTQRCTHDKPIHSDEDS